MDDKVEYDVWNRMGDPVVHIQVLLAGYFACWLVTTYSFPTSSATGQIYSLLHLYQLIPWGKWQMVYVTTSW